VCIPSLSLPTPALRPSINSVRSYIDLDSLIDTPNTPYKRHEETGKLFFQLLTDHRSTFLY